MAGSFNSFERELRKQKRKIMLSKVRARNRPHNQKFFELSGAIDAESLVGIISVYMPVKWDWQFFLTGGALAGWRRSFKLKPVYRRARSVKRERLMRLLKKLQNGNVNKVESTPIW